MSRRRSSASASSRRSSDWISLACRAISFALLGCRWPIMTHCACVSANDAARARMSWALFSPNRVTLATIASRTALSSKLVLTGRSVTLPGARPDSTARASSRARTSVMRLAMVEGAAMSILECLTQAGNQFIATQPGRMVVGVARDDQFVCFCARQQIAHDVRDRFRCADGSARQHRIEQGAFVGRQGVGVIAYRRRQPYRATVAQTHE